MMKLHITIVILFSTLACFAQSGVIITPIGGGSSSSGTIENYGSFIDKITISNSTVAGVFRYTNDVSQLSAYFITDRDIHANAFYGFHYGDGSQLTGLPSPVSWSQPSGTNLHVVFANNLQTFTYTNKSILMTWAGSNGSFSIRGRNLTNYSMNLCRWLNGTNGGNPQVITNGVVSFTAYGGTNDVVGAIKELQ